MALPVAVMDMPMFVAECARREGFRAGMQFAPMSPAQTEAAQAAVLVSSVLEASPAGMGPRTRARCLVSCLTRPAFSRHGPPGGCFPSRVCGWRLRIQGPESHGPPSTEAEGRPEGLSKGHVCCQQGVCVLPEELSVSEAKGFP